MFKFPGLPDELNKIIHNYKLDIEEEIKTDINQFIWNVSKAKILNLDFNINLNICLTIELYPQILDPFRNEIISHHKYSSGDGMCSRDDELILNIYDYGFSGYFYDINYHYYSGETFELQKGDLSDFMKLLNDMYYKDADKILEFSLPEL